MPEKIAWGILGTATIARKCMIPAMQASTKCRVHVIGSREPRSAADLAREHGIDQVTEGYDAVINDPAVNAVYIPLPNHLHYQWALKAFEAGKHVLCEKPLALDAREAEQMAAAARDSDRLLMEGFMYRFHPRSRRIRGMLAQGRLGALKLVRAAFCYRMDQALIDSGANFRLHPDTGGGALWDVGCYGVSTARWYFGAEPTAVQAQAVYHANGVDLNFVGSLKFKHGGLAVVEASFVSALQQTYTLAGDRAVIELPHDAYIPWEKDALFSIRPVDQESGRWITVEGADEYRLMVDHFVDAINKQTALAYSPADSIANMRVLDALAQAARSGESLRLASI